MKVRNWQTNMGSVRADSKTSESHMHWCRRKVIMIYALTKGEKGHPGRGFKAGVC